MASPRPPPALMIADVVGEILRRLPASEPACLIRASLVCKSWLRLASDATFLRRYRAFHGAPAPPLLALLTNNRGGGGGGGSSNAPRLVPFTDPTPFDPPPSFDGSSRSRRRPWVMDCRHGRALLFDAWDDSDGALAVWDPITGDRHVLPKPRCGGHVSAAAVLCAAAGSGCDHLDCHRGGPFLVVCLGVSSATQGGAVDAHVYSSEAASWRALASVQLGIDSYGRMNCGLVIGDEIYFTLKFTARILKYSLDTNAFTLIGVPVDIQFVLMRTEDDSLGLASVRDSNLYLWSWKDNVDGVAGWVNCRVIQLQAPFSTQDRFATSAIGFAEGVDVVILVNACVLFAVELKSGKVTKVGRPGDYYSALPIMGFCTPGAITGMNSLISETSLC